MFLNAREFFIFVYLFKCYQLDVEVSSDAAAAVKQQNDGQRQTFISSQSRAKTGKELIDEKSKYKEVGQRSTQSMRESNREWGYIDSEYTYSPEYWARYYPICNGKKQSPIALQTDHNKISSKAMTPLKLEGPDADFNIYGKVSNDGHTFGVKVDESRTNIRVSGGPLNNTYMLAQFHFHFGCDDFETGSEHSIDGEKFPSELHFVFYNTKYGNFDTAKENVDGLTVLGVLMKFGSGLNYVIHGLNRHLIDIDNPGAYVTLPYGLSLLELVKEMKGGIDKMNYVTYEGSLTTPPCFESVTWIVFQNPMKITVRDIQSWRKLNGAHNHKICNNYRPIQPTEGREVLFVSPTKGK